MTRPLQEYRDKRDFGRTPEPAGADSAGSATTGRSFIVQKHAATRLHWDFRLEWDGVLLSWAVTRGPSAAVSAKRLAVRTEDHPLDYATFEGTIAKPAYGAGTVMLWDRGTWAPLGDVDAGLSGGMLKFVLSGKRMRGAWMLVRMKPRAGDAGEKRENWRLIKEHDAHEEEDPEGLVTKYMTSVTTGRDITGIATGIAAKTKARARSKGGKAPALPAVPACATGQVAYDSARWERMAARGQGGRLSLSGGRRRRHGAALHPQRSGLDDAVRRIGSRI